MLLRVLLCGLMSVAMYAQTASLTGRVTDPSGAVVPDARVAVRSVGTGVTATVTTNQDGYYSAPSLPPGRYDVEISRDGFMATRQVGLELAVQQVARLDVVLKVGAVSERILNVSLGASGCQPWKKRMGLNVTAWLTPGTAAMSGLSSPIGRIAPQLIAP